MNRDNKLISIGLPVVNPQFLEQAIECCLQQTYTNFEIIIQNNSKDGLTKEKIKRIVLSFNDNRISYSETECQIPMVQNWNEILKKVNGELFTLLCDDDKWHPDFIKEMYKLSIKYPDINIFHSRVITIDIHNNEIDISPLCPEYEDGLDFIYHRIAGLRRMFVSDFMVRTNAILKIGGFIDLPDGWGSDDITWFKIALNGGVCYSSKELFYYRNSPLNTSNNKNIKNKLTAIDLQYKTINDIAHSYNYSLKVRVIKNQLLIFKDSKTYPLYINMLQNKYFLPLSLAKLFAMVIRYFKRRYQV